MTYTKCFCFITFCLLLEACAIDNPTPVKGVPTINNVGDNPNIYIASETKRSAVTWENGSAKGVAGTPLGSTLVDLAIYWKNSVAVNLENEASSNASSIVVTKNGDVYTAGWIDHQAVYWRNEMPTHFPIPFQDQGFLYSIFLTN